MNPSTTPTPTSLLTPLPNDGKAVIRLAHRLHPLPITITPYNPAWPTAFTTIKSHIVSALPPGIIQEINHIGSTSVPGLPAKNIIDIDLVVADVDDEDAYVGALEGCGFRFLFREGEWYGHRFFVGEVPEPQPDHNPNSDSVVAATVNDSEDLTTSQPPHNNDNDNDKDTSNGTKPFPYQFPFPFPVNLHVFPTQCDEVLRHKLFRDWLLTHPDDLELYARVKGEVARELKGQGKAGRGADVMEYTRRKEWVVREILGRAVREGGYV